jgi:hypothetical protein
MSQVTVGKLGTSDAIDRPELTGREFADWLLSLPKGEQSAVMRVRHLRMRELYPEAAEFLGYVKR